MVLRQQKWSRRAILTSGLLSAGLARWDPATAKAPIASNARAIRAKLDAIGRAVQAEIHAGHATGISISVAENGTIIWEGGFGLAHKKQARSATAHTPFSLASITKTFTTAAIMCLVEAGKLDLDAPINHYLRTPLPRSHFDTNAVTLRLLGGHAAGLPSLFEMFDQHHTPTGSADLVRDYGELAYPAGERFEYANLGYNLLGEAVSQVTGREFSSSLNDLVIRPLGLRNTFFDTDSARMASAAGRYDKNNGDIPFYTTATPPSGELYASAHDLNIFGATMMGIRAGERRPLLGQKSLDTLFSPVFTSRTGAFTTFGWSGRNVAGERMIVKTGGQPGVSARLTLLPTRKISIAVIANRDGTRDLVAQISNEIASLLISDWSNPDFRVDDTPPADAVAQDYDGSWNGSIRNGGKSEPVCIVFKAGGASMCKVGNGNPRPIQDIANHAPVLMFNVDGGLSATTADESAAGKLDFKLVLRDGSLIGRCLSIWDTPGFTATTPHIVTLSRSS